MPLAKFLRGLPNFSEFADSELEVLEKSMAVREYDDGHVFTEQGRRGTDLYLVMEGEVAVSRKDDVTHTPHELKVMGVNQIFGVLSLLDHAPANATCTARGKVRAASLPAAAYDMLYHHASPIAYHLQLLIAGQLARDLADRNQSLRAQLAL